MEKAEGDGSANPSYSPNDGDLGSSKGNSSWTQGLWEGCRVRDTIAITEDSGMWVWDQEAEQESWTPRWWKAGWFRVSTLHTRGWAGLPA